MSFRGRLFLAFLVAVLVPLGALAFGVRREMNRRLTSQYEERVTALVSVIETDLSRESEAVAGRLAALASDIVRDNRFRLAAISGDQSARRYLLDYAGSAMRLAGLAMLQIQDSAGVIISSGHFRNQFDQRQPELPRAVMDHRDTLVLVQTRTPEAPLLALARSDSFRLGGKRFSLTGGIEAARWLQRWDRPDSEVAVALVYPGVVPARSPDEQVVREVRIPFLDLLSSSGREAADSRLLVTHETATLEALRRGVNRWFLLALGLTAAVATIAAAWLSSRISRPLRELASKTAAIDLDRLDQSFDTDRRDEIGALSRLLGAMTERLRASSTRLREAERRAAIGELARQVTHDIKNGLTPIRNVLRHMGQIVNEDPTSLPEVFKARRGTLESSVEYLDTLARNYDRLSPGTERRPYDVNTVVRQVVANATRDGVQVHAQLAAAHPQALGDALMLRRALENLVGNGLDSVAGRPDGVVTVSSELVGSLPDRVRITVSDNGPGMTRAELDRAFDDFYTTKTGGSGLGLSIVRRLVLDLNGTLRVETEPGVGTRASIELPTVPNNPETP
ncbi:MAG TPA: ATP-binding protein [Gemmatimonadales bacterium]|nr:ATP-binding protein [Gemmatimonadales bacterium]